MYNLEKFSRLIVGCFMQNTLNRGIFIISLNIANHRRDNFLLELYPTGITILRTPVVVKEYLKNQ